MPNSTDRIYLTYKTRMTTEQRLRRTGYFVYTLLNWYAFLLIAVSIVNLSHLFIIPYVDLYSTLLSAGVFGLTLFASGEKYSERADKFKACYLELQSLYQGALPSEQKVLEYHQILKRYHNQSDDDYDDMVFDSYLRGKRLTDASGEIRLSKVTISRVIFRRVYRYLLAVSLFVAPLAALYIWVTPETKVERPAESK